MSIRTSVAAALALGGILFASTAVAQAQTPPPVEAYGRLPAVSGVSISPDGQRLIAGVAEGDASAFQVINLSTGRTEHNYGVPADLALRGVGWSDDGHAIVNVSRAVRHAGTRRYEVGSLIAFTLSNQRQRDLEVGNGLRPVRGEPGIGLGVARDDSGRLSVFRINLENGTSRRISSAVQDSADIVFNDDGEILARVDSDQDANRWSLHVYNNGQPVQVIDEPTDIGLEPMNLAGVLADGRVVAIGRRQSDPRARMFAISSNGQIEVIGENERYDIGGPILEPRTNRVVGVQWIEDLPKQRFFDPELQAVADRVSAYFASGYGVITSWSADRQRFVVSAETNRDAGAYYLFEPATNTMRIIRREYPELTTAAAIGERQSINYRSRDGTQIPAYLTLPAGGGRDLPLVLLPHGGPHARDVFAFDWWAAFLASRGYAVLQPNFRGSTGYGYDWFNAGRNNWGDGIMQTDIEDGVDALIRAGIADPTRVCIVGASYGGYAALAGATLSPERFRCAISIAGVSDLPRMVEVTARDSGSRFSGISDWWAGSMGDAERQRRVSPVNHAGQVRAQILLMHGDNDSVVPLEQSQRMVSAMRDAGKETQLIVLRGEDHWLSNASTRIQMLRDMETFLAQHMRPAQINVDDSGAPAAQRN
ncbi:MAG TPA: S9 family peptidase [Candidatus Binatia bacterium]|nr:S9 family peptidase [Candidatus Binatia bacterium]